MIRVDKTFTAKDNSFQVAFEGEPTYSNQVIPTSLGDIEMKSFRLLDAQPIADLISYYVKLYTRRDAHDTSYKFEEEAHL